MAETSSIANRMEKLAKLKRMKKGLSGDAEKPDEIAEPALAEPGPVSSNSVETELDVVVAMDHAESGVDVDIEDALGLGDDVASGAPALGGADHADFEGGASDELGNSDFAAAAFDDEDDDDFSIPDDLQEAPTAAEDPESLESYMDALEIADEQTAAKQSSSSSMRASELDIDDDTMGALDELAALAGVRSSSDDALQMPDFTMSDVEPETLEREFEHEQADADASTDSVTASADVEGRIAVTFDESRTTLLNHVSRQMNCSVEDVVVTALDWYLDALFGEDDEAKAG